jgi:hypothetical protein
MGRKRLTVLVLVALTALASGLALATTGSASKGHGKGKRAHHHLRHHGLLQAKLRGAEEVPGPGDPDGRGKAHVRVLPRFGAVCFELSWRNIGEPTAAHIHEGERGEAGPVVVPLFMGEADERGCVDDLDEDLLREIQRHPREYYVNVHNAEYPNGAIRGQLRPGGHGHGWARYVR